MKRRVESGFQKRKKARDFVFCTVLATHVYFENEVRCGDDIGLE